jgi:hypothetical protein
VQQLTAVNGLDGFADKLSKRARMDKELLTCTLGIDATHYLRELYHRDSIMYSLPAAIGGIPPAFKTEVERDLADFAKYNLTVKFVFDGLDLYNFNLKDKKSWKSDPTVGPRNGAWDTWQLLAEKGRFADAEDREKLARRTLKAFAYGKYSQRRLTAATEVTPAVNRYFMEILTANNTEFLVAPVSAKAQVNILERV